jgi:ribonucleoside-triphosphate reductase
MRNLEDIEKDLAAAREALSSVEGTSAEVYSRIVGYYRSVRNWNRGKREEYGERRLYRVSGETPQPVPVKAEEAAAKTAGTETAGQGPGAGFEEKGRLLLFVRPACPACPSAKDAAGQLGIPVDLVNADTEEGLAEAGRRNVFSTPTAILLGGDGSELDRARDSGSIAAWGKRLAV